MRTITIVLGILLGIAILGSGALYYVLKDNQKGAFITETELSRALDEKSKAYDEATTHITLLESQLKESQDLLASTTFERNTLADELYAEKNRNEEFEDQIKKIGSTVGTLDKLAKTDPELLMKYSKVYFLNEHYTPPKLSEIEKQYLYDESVPKFIHAQVAPFLEDMIKDAADDNIKLWVKSAFRSFDEQEDLKGVYTVAYGSGANTFSADQGYSEHQLGTTIDLTTEGLGGGLTNFETTAAYMWLQKNAHKYGFVLSYPKDNGYYIFEPWHWRFVGTELAEDLHDDDTHFYDLSQREIDVYLVSIFD